MYIKLKQKGHKMSKIRMNTEFRNKILNRYVDNAETENTQEREAYLDAREKVDALYPLVFDVAKEVVSRAYPDDDVQTCRTLKQKYGSPLDVVAKDKCFYFSYAKDQNEIDQDEERNEANDNVSEYILGTEIPNETRLVKAQEEFGDILFTLVNVARWLGLSPEEALAQTNQRFLKRFSYLESQLKGNLSNQNMTQLKKLWIEAKENE